MYPVSRHHIERGEKLDAFPTKPGTDRDVQFHYFVKSNWKCKSEQSEKREKRGHPSGEIRHQVVTAAVDKTLKTPAKT